MNRFTLLAFALATLTAAAQPATNAPAIGLTNGVVPVTQVVADAGDENIEHAVGRLLADPVVFSAFMTPLTNAGWTASHSNAVLSLINELHLRPNIFRANDGSDDVLLGIEYDFNKSIHERTLNPDSINPAGLSLNAFAKGAIAESANRNPHNFLESGAQLHLFQALGGVMPAIPGRDEIRARNDAMQRASEIESEGAEFENDPRWKHAGKELMKYARPQFSYDLSGHATLESDQKFRDKQWAYGGKVSLVYQDWRESSAMNWFNVLDIPFAALRAFTMDRERLEPSGRAFPVVIAGIDLIDPSDNDERTRIDSDNSVYPRFRAEIGFKTQVTRLFGEDIWFSSAYRFFQEIGASRVIRAADIDQFHYFVARLDLPKGFNVSYAAGKLPLDLQSEQVVTLGYSINFK